MGVLTILTILNSKLINHYKYKPLINHELTMKINDSLTVQTCKNKKKPDDRVRRPGLLPETLPQTLAAVAALVSMVNVGGDARDDGSLW